MLNMVLAETIFSTIFAILPARKDTPNYFWNAAIIIIFDFIFVINEELGCVMLVTLFTELLSLHTFVLTIGWPSNLVTHCTGGASIQVVFTAFWKSRSA